MKKKIIVLASLILMFGISGSEIGSTAPEERTSAFQSAKLIPVSIYDEKNLLQISIEDVGKYHGDICLCATVAFRAIQLAISELWKPARSSEKEAGGDEIPQREDFRIISALPTQGSQDCFEFITRAKTRGDFTLDLPQGTDEENLSMENWVFTFIRKSTNEQVKVRVKEEISIGGSKKFFNLRKKVEFDGTATAEEKEIFELTKRKLKEVFMNLPENKLFVFEKKKGTE